MSPVSLDCPFLIGRSVFSNVYLQHLDYLQNLRVPNLDPLQNLDHLQHLDHLLHLYYLNISISFNT